MKRISIIIPCYNAERYIDICLRSVFKQDYPDVELIIINDGSIDKSGEKILAWESYFIQKGWLFHYLFQDNAGLGAAISSGLKFVSGDYLTLLDADDYFLPRSFEKRASFLNDHPEYVGVRSNGWMIRGDEKELFVTLDEEKAITDLFDGLLCGKTNNWAGSYMIRTDALFAFYPDRSIFPSRFGQNMQMLLPVAYKNKFGFIDEPLMAYVIHENSHSQASSQEEQYKKDERNQQGYREIYLHMIDAIVKDPLEHERYCDIFNASYHRCAMQRASKYGKTDQFKASYRELLKTGLATLDDRICYYNVISSPVSILLRVMRKIYRVLNR